MRSHRSLVTRADTPAPLLRAPQEIALTYRFSGTTHTLDDYLARNPVTGLLIARDDTILFEHYQSATPSWRSPSATRLPR